MSKECSPRLFQLSETWMDSNLFVFFFWQSNGKAEKFFGDFGWLEAGRESTILVSVGFASCLYSADNINSSSSQRSCASFVSSR